VCGGHQTGPNPTDRSKRGSKRHLICDGAACPLVIRLTGANRMTQRRRCHSSMRSHPYKASEDAHDVGPSVCWVTVRTTEAIRIGLRVRHIRPLLAMRRTKSWQWSRPVALGCRAYLCLVESVSSPARPVRKTARHPRGSTVSRLRVDLLAVSAKGLHDWLSAWFICSLPVWGAPNRITLDHVLVRWQAPRLV
jgi:hypothetical protein